MRPDTTLYRQIPNPWIKNGTITTQAFKPTTKDENKLSLAHGGMITAQESMDRHRKDGFKSDGVASLLVAEFQEVDIEPVLDGKPYRDHVSAPFDPNWPRKTVENKAKALKAKAKWAISPN